MERARLSTLVLFLGGLTLFVDMFLHWTRPGESFVGAPAAEGWDIPLIAYAGLFALALSLVEFVRVRRIWRSRASSLLAFFLAAGAALMVVAGLIHVHWSYTHLTFSRYGYGAWVALAIAVALAIGAALRLAEHRVE